MRCDGIRAVAAVLGAVVLAAGAISVPSTTAAWTDDVHVSSTAGAGTWSAPAAANPGDVVGAGPGTAVTGVTWTVPTLLPVGQTCVDVTVTGTSATPQPWSITVRLDGPPFFGAPASALYYGGTTQVTIAAGPTSATAVVSGVGTGTPFVSAWSNKLLTTTRTLTVRLCTMGTRTPAPADPSWYTATQAVSGSWTATRACVAVTVTGNRDTAAWPFWFGWQTSVELAAAKAHIVAAGRTVNYVSWSPDPSSGYQFTTSPAATSPVADRYTLTSGTLQPIRGTGSTTVTACVLGF